MPITMHKKTKPVTRSNEDEQNSSSVSFLPKLWSRIPAALILLILLFLWSSSTTLISGSIVHVCVTSRKLNNRLYCFSAGDQTADANIPVLTNTTASTSQKNLAVFTSNVDAPLEIKEEIGLIKSVERPLIATIQLSSTPPSGGGVEKKERVANATQGPVPSSPTTTQLPVANNTSSKDAPGAIGEDERKSKAVQSLAEGSYGEHLPKEVKETKNKIISRVSEVKTPVSIIRLPVDDPAGNGDGKSTNVTTTPASITIREKTPVSIIRLPVDGPAGNGDGKSTNITTTPASITIREKTENKTRNQEEIEVARKDVEEQMEVLRSYKKAKIVNNSNPESCDGRRIYVYDLPTKFNKDLLGYCSEMINWMDFCKFLSNNAFGEAVPQLGNGWYNTHQYALEPIFHARVLKHPCRVHDPEKAKLFYVPYYGGFDILRWHFKENTTLKVKDKLSYELIEWLNQQKPWKRNFGLDHLFVLGKITWDFRRVDSVGWGTRFLDLDEMQNPMKLLIERQPWEINDIGVPHPSFFHPRSDDDIVVWQKKIMQKPRKNLVSFVGAPRPKDRDSIRSILIEQCTSAGDKCKFFDCREHRCTKTEAVVESLTESEFCLQPPGDSPTRKSVFDSLVAGCIPVLFDPFTAYYQYPWHLPANQSAYSVFVDQNAVRRREVNVIDRLAAVPADRRAEMRRLIVEEVLPGLVYADPEGKLERFADAFTVAINGVIERMIRLP